MGVRDWSALNPMKIRAGIIGILLALVLSVPVSAQLGNWRNFDFFNLIGGLNNTSDPSNLDPSEASDLQNVIFSSTGGIAKREGFAHLNAVTVGATATFTGLTF